MKILNVKDIDLNDEVDCDICKEEWAEHEVEAKNWIPAKIYYCRECFLDFEDILIEQEERRAEVCVFS